MDFSTMGFYGAVCGALAGSAPLIGGVWARVATGAAVGIVAALVVPTIRGMMTGY